MAVKRTIRRYRLGGVNRSADLDAENLGAASILNMLPCPSGGICGREGFKVTAQVGAQYANGGVMGMTESHIPDLQQSSYVSSRKDELIIASITGTNNDEGGLYRAKRFAITMVNAGSGVYSVTLWASGGLWQFIISRASPASSTTVNLGTPQSNVNSFAQLATAVNSAFSDVTISYESDFQTSRSASYLMPFFATLSANSRLTIDFITGAASPFVSEGPAITQKLLAHSCLLSQYLPARKFHGIQFQNRLWFRDIWRLRKYDGKNGWFAGVRAPASATRTPSTVGGSIADGTYGYLLTYSVKDAQNYEVESDGTEVGTATVSGGGGSGSITLSAIAARAGWVPADAGMSAISSNGWGAVCSSSMGAPGTVITCATYLKLDVGDPVYLYDRATSLYVDRYVTAVTATTVTVNSNVQLNSGDALSPVRINIYRTKTGPSTLFYFIKSIPLDISAATQSYTDTANDSALAESYETPLVAHTPPPTQPDAFVPVAEDESGSFPIEMYRNSLVMGGLYDDRGACAFSDIDSPEYWPAANRLRPGEGVEKITGLKASQDFLLIFTERSTYQLTGELTTGESRTIPLGRGIGCSSHDSIADCGGVVYWCSETGVYRSSGGAPEKISADIEDLFIGSLQTDANNAASLRFNRAIGCFVPDKHQYWLFVPQMFGLPTSSYPWAADSVVGAPLGTGLTSFLVFDINTSQWFVLKGVDAALGLRFFDGELIGLSSGTKTYSGANDKLIQLIQRIQRTDQYAAVEDSTARGDSNLYGVWQSYVSRFDSLGKPGVLKKPLRMRVECLNTTQPAVSTITMSGLKDYADPASTGYTSKASVYLAAATSLVHKWRLLPRKVLSFAFGITNAATVYDRLTLTGVEVEFAESYRDGFKEPNG